MNELEAFFQAKHNQLKDNYGPEEHCGLISRKEAKIVQDQGKRPSIFSIRPASSDPTKPEAIVPRVYKGRVQWGGHMVCVVDGLVWDPMLEQPEPFKTYAKRAFEGPVEMVNDDRLLDFWEEQDSAASAKLHPPA